jgi:hypothetical protein
MKRGKNPFRKFVTKRKVKGWARDSFNEAEGDEEKAKVLFEAKAKSYGMDPVVIASLIISVIRFWLWLKEKGFLKYAPDNGGEEFFADLKDMPDE